MKDMLMGLTIVTLLALGLVAGLRTCHTESDASAPGVNDPRTYFDKRSYCANVDRPNPICDGERPR